MRPADGAILTTGQTGHWPGASDAIEDKEKKEDKGGDEGWKGGDKWMDVGVKEREEEEKIGK